MARNASTGAYTMPVNSFRPAVTGTTIDSTAWNATAADIEMALSYVYGTFTPTLKFGGNNIGMTGTFTGEYTQIGNRIFYSISVTLTAKGSSTGSAAIGALPVTAAGTQDRCFVIPELVTINTAGGYLGIRGAHNGTDVFLRQWGNNVSTVAIADTDFSNTSIVILTGHYRV